MIVTTLTYRGLHGQRTVHVYDAEPIESAIFGPCLLGLYGEVHDSGVAQIAEPGLFRLRDAVTVERSEQIEMLALDEASGPKQSMATGATPMPHRAQAAA